MGDGSLNRRRWLQQILAAATVANCSLRGILPQDLPSVHDRILRMAHDAPLRLAFRGTTAEECRRWQSEFSSTLQKLLGPFAPPADWTFRLERQTKLEDHTRDELLLFSEGYPTLPVYLLTPNGGSSQRLPGIVAVHGHGAFGYDAVAGRTDTAELERAIASANYDYGRQLVRRGYVVGIPCLTPFGRRMDDRKSYGGDDPCAVTFVRMQMFGKLLIAENLRDVLWAFELVRRHEMVDPDRIGCVGLSYGGRMTMLAAALEPKIRVAVISGALNLMQERVALRYSCGAQVIPGLLEYGDVPEIGSLIAPRPALWEVGRQDQLMPREWVENGLVRLRRAYRALGAEEKLAIDWFDGPHRWNGVLAYPLLEDVLKPS